jgi:cytochrome c peroxidase
MKHIAMRKSTLSIVFGCALLASCDMPDPDLAGELVLELPATPYSYSGLQNDAVPTLGRVLFYDRALSLNNTVSCASCHKQSKGFADNVALSKGFEGKNTKRNSLSIQNLQPFAPGGCFCEPGPGIPQHFGAGGLFWDGREGILMEMVMRPVADHIEMGITNPQALAQKLQQIPYYADLFTAAYNSSEIRPDLISHALHQFLIEIRADRTTLDRAMQGEIRLNELEQQGQELFFSKYDCNSCHGVQSASGYIFNGTFANIGLDEQYSDNGLSLTTKNAADAGKFRIPSLRNVALTGPYMHDGRFKSLGEVIDHYSETIADHPNLDNRLRSANGAPARMNISDREKKAIIAFLQTMTDHEMISDVRFSDPFKLKFE